MCGACLDLAAAFSNLWKIFVSCPSGFFSFLGPQKLIRSHYASQGPVVSQRHACRTLECLPHAAQTFCHCFSSERATCPSFHPLRRPWDDAAAQRLVLILLNPTAGMLPVVLSRVRFGEGHEPVDKVTGIVLKDVCARVRDLPCGKPLARQNMGIGF